MIPGRLRRVALGLLQALMGLAAVGGGADLVLSNGSLMGMPPGLLRGSPFDSFLVPGLVLLAVGLANLVGASGVAVRRGWGAPVSAVVGLAWVGWFVVQVAAVGFVSWQQPFYFLVGAAIFALAVPSVARGLRTGDRDTTAHRGSLRAEGGAGE